MKRSTTLIAVAGAVALATPLLWLIMELRAMGRELSDWKAAQVAFVAQRPTPEQIVPRSLVAPYTASVIKRQDGTVEFVVITGPQWHYAWFEIDDTGRAVTVTFSAK